MNTLVFNGKRKIYQYSSIENLFFKVTKWALLLGLFYPIVNNGSTITNLISLLCTLLSITAIVLYYSISNRPKLSTLTCFYIFVVLYMLIIGVVGGGFSGGRTHFMKTMSQDVRYVSLFWLGGLYALSDKYMVYFHKIMLLLARISVVLGLVALAMLIQRGVFIARGVEETDVIYHLWWALICCSVYSGYYALINRSKQRVFLFVLLLYFVLGMAFLKRSCFVDVIIIVVFALFLLSRQGRLGKGFGMMAFVGFIVMLVIFFFPTIFDDVFSSLFSRFSDTAEDVDSFDRLVEWRVFQDNTTLRDRLFGKGVGAFLIYERYGKGEASVLNALHLGYANIIYKGGILYALFYIILYIKVIVNWFRNRKKTSFYLVCFGVAISSLISLFFEGSWTYTIQPFCISAPIFYAATYSGDKRSVQ